MKVEEDVSLARLTTLKVGGNAQWVMHCTTVEELKEAVAFSQEKNLPWYVLGGGSNVLAQDEGFRGVVIVNALSGYETVPEGDTVVVTAGAGMVWDELVTRTAHDGLWGIENLAGIPGTVGASPLQNIGAYGSEISDVVRYVDAYDTHGKTLVRFSNDECQFSYRDSRFKHERKYIVTSVTFALSQAGSAQTRYPDLQRAKESGERMETPKEVGALVRRIRSRKFPDMTVYGTAGSFFKNPILSKEVYVQLKKRYPELPRFPYGENMKIPLAYILDHVLHMKGHRYGKVRLFDAQPLVLVTEENAVAQDVDVLAEEVIAKVFTETGISIEREVQTLHAM